MRWCRVRVDGVARSGLVEEATVRLVTGAPWGYTPTGEVLPLSTVDFLPPVRPGTFFCVGLNYRGHVGDAPVPQRPEVGYRANSALIGHGEAIVRPGDCTGRFEAEGELVAVIGRPLRRCTRQEAMDAILGWTIGNDVSARDWQRSDRTFWRAKNSDTFKPMGPWIETSASPLASRTTVAVNGEVRGDFPTGDMIFDPYEFLCAISRYITVSPGDVLWLGTDASVGMSPGDSVSITISGIGTLTNPVVAES